MSETAIMRNDSSKEGLDVARKAKKRSTAPKRPMPADAMRQWRAEMGWSERDAAKALGINRTTLRASEESGATLTVALACAAVAAGLKPWGIADV